MISVTRPQAWQGVIAAYRDRLPVTEETPVVTLLEGGTPLVPALTLSARLERKPVPVALDQADTAQPKSSSITRIARGGERMKPSWPISRSAP